MGTASSPWELGARSETGYVRSANEDRMGWVRTAFGDVYVVSDGMGGQLGGAVAAEVTVQTLQDQLGRIAPDSSRFSDAVRQAFLQANADVFARRDPDDPNTRDMGATGVAVVTSGARFIVAHVGDSRAYLWRRSVGLRRLTKDHTRVQTLLDAGLLTPEEAAVHPDASVLDRAIGHQAGVQVDVSDWIGLQSGDMLLLCSDGLCGYVRDEEIAAILAAAKGAQEATDRLVECALAKGGEDNVTVQLIGYALSPRRRTLALPTRLGALPAAVLASAVTAAAVGSAGYAWHADQMARAGGPAAAASAAASAPRSKASDAVPGTAAAVACPASPASAAPPGGTAAASTGGASRGGSAAAAAGAAPAAAGRLAGGNASGPGHAPGPTKKKATGQGPARGSDASPAPKQNAAVVGAEAVRGDAEAKRDQDAGPDGAKTGAVQTPPARAAAGAAPNDPPPPAADAARPPLQAASAVRTE